MDTNGIVKDTTALIEDTTSCEHEVKSIDEVTIDIVVVDSVEDEKKVEDDSSSVTELAIVSADISCSITTLIPPRLRQEHRLRNRWTFWFLNAERELDWLERLKQTF
ncbi:hypothetical protein Mgra_00005646 [Meloidogyne graminicola]|uniref:Uncharacterized protein n=1 Tax=Meloidogyne graminicola TaxID=189291 RepID=A0A8S9ZNA8_9BILA|nr:hypothetical protein Mgra_00005646 [Meloidogyne graminicola]